MKLIVGLGNEGGRYEGTRHNVGMEAVRQLARRHRVAWACRRPRSVYGDWHAPQGLIRLMCPLTMMNASGEAFTAAADWRVAPTDILILCDDVNLPLGRLRLRPGGSDGGHHGLASCLEALGTHEVPRLRLGVGCEPLPTDLTEFVLSPFTVEEQRLIDQAVKRATEACEVWAREGMPVAMNRVNVRNKGVRGEP
ncbi:MAG TPA: aminoacyl-tRNA hydrolase [Candidatus Omnitrophica bacterium]|nr:MAG: aminoacyl-tRNA hydrolase [Omnitrophica WOR_2 bacterium GWA2_63_20]OGX31991.1 MAG: aminoacyl-tRNA hydrolase [Omnitrophica WOR_2 bacterium RIFCSPHIGHO2_12_FULL_64_13]OGX35591.1 MAG: aminoacyl-tRNA hydrolase [Omnitrophica WOR_2 bacterium RIFCSPHIGHO2_02_FULL_63_39]OGX46302.1 MAG: aminoacyl-tRNA hydrolase [Omnitrophica WOR_2 bacterium RIFCSPLOWO2_02_FULL_63_16]OGX47080.1 MAG: aminoacyl-tRNA hydrolase [Omnitrophica WOR_2 bacterium RIFCSPLOWO2_12_FULL_63_16]HAM41601.1 aminoacyl-tRNA hydrolas